MASVARSKEVLLREADVLALEQRLSELKSEDEIYAFIKQRVAELEDARKVLPCYNILASFNVSV